MQSIYKRSKQRINARSMAPNKMVGFMVARRWEKTIEPIFTGEN